MSNLQNDYITDYLKDQIEEGMAIIYKAIKSGKLLVEFKRWEYLHPTARIIALEQVDFIKSAVKAKADLDEYREMASSCY